jgi:2-hydroxychromene-2-carboxylate isomerase
VATATDQPTFYYDLGSPECYLAAERIMATLPVAPEWEPVLFGASDARVERDAIARRALELGLQPLRWPPSWPPEASQATLAATYAKQIGRAVAFSLATFRQEFAGGRDLGDENTVLIAAAACEVHPTALLRGISMRSVAAALERAVDRAGAVGVTVLPAIQVGERVFEGERCVEDAALALGAAV